MLYVIFLFNPQNYKQIRLLERNKAATDFILKFRPILFSKVKPCPVSLTYLQEVLSYPSILADFPYFLFFAYLSHTLSICNTELIISLSVFSFSGMWLFETTHLISSALKIPHIHHNIIICDSGKQEFRSALSIPALLL